ncbi:hypothetical protein GCM10028778_11200 [Barrientosiimonas marina]|uniref:NlpC/P60 family protein n=1 Tax=Lentibacillus kimchii TaxID=1542911 RepID=A0ABW2UYV1_9BACI
MLNGPMRHFVKQSVLYTCVLSQPLAFYADAYPALQHEQLAEAEQLQYADHDKATITLQQKSLKSSSSDQKIESNVVSLTERALQNFEDHHDLTITEQADQKILNTIIENEDNRYKTQLENMSGSVQPSMDQADVKTLQLALDHFDYYQGNIDGLYGPLTQKAVKTAEEELDMDLIDQEAMEELSKENQNSEPDDNANNGKKATSTQDEQEQKNQKSEKAAETVNQEPKQVKGQDNQHQQAIKAARNQIGTPYDWGGESPDGFDCSGFIQYIFQMEDKSVPRTVSEMWNFTAHVNSPSIGDLVFFETYKPGPSHMGIYIGNDQFIHAGESRGVEKSKLSNSYWNERYIGAGSVR